MNAQEIFDQFIISDIEKAKQWYESYPLHLSTDAWGELAVLTASLIEVHPEYDHLATCFLLNKINNEVKHFRFTDYIEYAIAEGLLTPELNYKVDTLQQYLNYDYDHRLVYRGLTLLYDKYLLRDREGVLLETPQFFWMRIAMGIALPEIHMRTTRTIAFYDTIASLHYLPSTPTLFNAGTKIPQLASCYVQDVEDSIEGIFEAYADQGRMSKLAGGIGTNWSSIRSAQSKIKSINGSGAGLIPWLGIQDAIAYAVNQGGKRKGAHCVYLEPWHAEIEEFITLRKPTGDERRRTPNLHTAVWIPDLFMHRVEADENWSLFCPSDVPHLTDKWGVDFDNSYVKAESEGFARKTIKARDLWRKILTSLYETGHPWITFKDTVNRSNPMHKIGLVRSSNLCTEITLNTAPNETAVCNLGSINLERHVTDGQINYKKLGETVRLAVRMLDNIIDIMYYPHQKAADTNRANRPIGLGIMGWQNALYKMPNVKYPVKLAEAVQQFIQTVAIQESEHLAKERGEFPNFKHSTFTTPRRNSHLTAIAPTATISHIAGTSPSIEPLFSNLYTEAKLSGDFTIINEYLVRDLIELGLWTQPMRDVIKAKRGSIQDNLEIPKYIRDKYKTAFEINQFDLIEQAAYRQKYVCQSQSLNLYTTTKSGKELSNLYFWAWRKGLKTTYYLRTQGQSNAEQSTVDPNIYGQTHVVSCSIDNEDCEACQ